MANLLDLPPEIRNRIYFLVESLVSVFVNYKRDWVKVDGGDYVGDGYISAYHIPYQDFPDPPNAIRFPRKPNITKVCRKIRSETLPIYYGSHRFTIMDQYVPRLHGIKRTFPSVMFDWLDHIEPHVSLIKWFQVGCIEGCAQEAHELWQP